MRKDFDFFTSVRVRFNEADPQGIVHNANYIIYTEEAIESYFRSKGYTYKELVVNHEAEICHRKNTIEYISSAFEGDDLDIGMKILRLGNSSVTMLFEIFREGEDDALVRLESIFVSYDSVNRKSKPFGKLMRKIFGE